MTHHLKVVPPSGGVDLDYKALFEVMEEGVLIQDASGWVLASNESLRRILGSVEHIHAFYEDGSPVPEDEIPAQVTLRTGLPLSGVILQVQKHSGSLVWVSVNTRPIQRPGSKPHGVMSTFSDITAQKTMEKALRESEGKLRAFIREAPVGILMTNAIGSCVFANKTWCEMCGLDRDECMGQGWTRAVHEDDQRTTFTGWKRLSDLSRPLNTTLRFSRSPGDTVWAQVKAVEMKDDTGQVIGYLWAATDVTEQKRAEEERDQLFTVSLDLMCIANLQGYFERVNPSFPRVLGHSQEEFLARPILDFVHPDDKADTQEEFSKVASGYESVKFENRVRCRDGSWRWLSWNCQVHKELLYIVARDVTERKRTEATLIRLAHTDPLTGLQNRSTLMNQLAAKIETASKYSLKIAILFVDLDDFKEVNDEYGHDAGDVVIREVASRLKSSVRRTDIVSRLGGDEYVVVLDDINNEASAQVISAKILATLSDPVHLPSGGYISPKASIGVAIYPSDGSAPEGLLKAADKAMYESKRSGGHRIALPQTD